MSAVPVYNKNNENCGELELTESVFNVEVNESLVHDAVKAHLAARRQGNAKTKERNEIAGSTRKLFPQKGRGAARKGAITSPVLVGGGTVFGPQPRDYTLKMNKKARKSALHSALTSQLKKKRIVVLDEFPQDIEKTKDVATLLKTLELAGKSVLLVHEDSTDLYREYRRCSDNIPKVKVVTAGYLNTYDVLAYSKLVFSKDAIQKVE